MADEIFLDFPPLFRVYKDGILERLTGKDVVPPSLDPATRVQSKDVQIAAEFNLNLSARIYLPPDADPTTKLPLLVYFHGEGFVVGASFSPDYHKHLNYLVAQANVVAVSVSYCLAPEFPILVAFEDSWHALKWCAEGDDEWINEFTNLKHVYLGGDRTGGNISHNIAMRVGLDKPEGFNLEGMFLNCPAFGGEDRIGWEKAEEFKKRAYYSEKLWKYVCPSMRDRDEAWVNPGRSEFIKFGLPESAGLCCGKGLPQG